MKYGEHLHPICIFLYFLSVIGMSLACMDPMIAGTSAAGAVAYLCCLKGRGALFGWLRFAFLICLFVAAANPLLNHRGVTVIGTLFGQWITWEAVCYGLTAGLSLTALLLWFACYQEVMTGDKFLYLFGKIAPASALLVTMALQMTGNLHRQQKRIRDAQRMLYPEDRWIEKLYAALRHTSALIGWGVEHTVELADSMKARGYGMRRRTTFHLFRFDGRDARFLGVLAALAGSCVTGRLMGYGMMEFYPRIRPLTAGRGVILLYILYALLAFLPALLEGREVLRWRFCGLIR